MFIVFFFQAEDGIRDLVRSRGLGDVYKRQALGLGARRRLDAGDVAVDERRDVGHRLLDDVPHPCLLYTSDAADQRSSVDLGGPRIIKKKTKHRAMLCHK